MIKKRSFFIVIILAILAATAFLIITKLNNITLPYSDQYKNSSAVIPTDGRQGSEVVSSSIPELNCQNGWQEYHQDTLGIAFCYPLEWGEPGTTPLKNITDIATIQEAFTEQNTYYDNSISITFEKNVGLHMQFFNNRYSGKSQRDINEPNIYYESGVTDAITSLRNDGDICDYSIGYTYKYTPEMYPNTLKMIYSNCKNEIKEVLTNETNNFTYSTGNTLYNYDLRFLSFKKIANGYFDNVLISQKVDQAIGINENLETLDAFFDSNKTTTVDKGLPTKNREQVDRERNEFEQFTKNIIAFKPVSKKQSEFVKIPGEDENITTIKQYYWFIDSGKLNEAYAMYFDKKNTNFDAYKTRYQNVYFAKPFDFKSIGKNRYDFHVQYQDHNSSKMEFHVIMDVGNNIVKTVFLEEYTTDISRFGKITAYAARRGDKNYVFLNKNGKEVIIDQGDAHYDSNYQNISNVKHFSQPQFSPTGRYLTYSMSGWEWSVGYIYDTKKNEKLGGTLANDLSEAGIFEFTPDEKYLYMCSSSGMSSGPGGKIYSVPEFKIEYDLLENSQTKGFMSVNCSYDKDNSSILFQLSDYSNEDTVQNSRSLLLKYNLDTKK